MVFDTTKLTYIRNGGSLKVDSEKCSGCGACVDVCPHAVFRIRGSLATIVERERCMECGACRLNCPSNAITVSSGVGCVAAIVAGMRNRAAPSCGCDAGASGKTSEKTGCCG